ncbi:multiheme c-type cytochrome [Geobacter sulfurreducens]|uniref:multiheme c-type cytochrome n=1 Tax=Geobacter sulfurreducens TaxID=35554 RepID=UPI0020B8C7C8|nr:CxxxxCH/CxxCH domain-containing protein [Geobacter sulfurreducens]UTG92231.1 CxxxxCH/CxxCH domain-containing protein [Geobacter sulfurreducens]
MNGILQRTFVTALVTLFVPIAAWAIDYPHELGSVKGYKCSSCHTVHSTLGSTGYNNVCLTCHNPSDPYGSSKPFAMTDFANPFRTWTSARPAVTYQTSHNWIGKDVVPKAGAVAPSDVRLTKSLLIGTVSCARCHNIHDLYSSAYNSKPFLRVRNDEDQLCLDCHRPRKTVDHTRGSHPVTVNYSTKAAARPDEFYSPPRNSNPANPTSAMRMSRSGAVVCTTCHGVHYTDSNSRTFDNASSARMGLLSTSRGMLLRTDLKGRTVSDPNICTNCHKSADDPANTTARVKNHNGTKNQNVQCADCHGGHVDEADGTAPNAYLINRYMNISTQYGAVRNAKVMYQYTSVARKNWNKDAFGVCLACHSPLPGTIGQHSSTNAADCRSCHTHSQGFSANCTQCHGFPPTVNTAGGPSGYGKDGVRDYSTSGVFKNETQTPHARHAGGGANYSIACDQCHKGFSHNTGTFQDVFVDKTGIIASIGSGANPTYNPAGNGTCTATYCHSDGAPRNASLQAVVGAPGNTTFTWGNGVGKLSGCSSCHAAFPLTNAHPAHFNAGIMNCQNCHYATLSGPSTIKDKSVHVDGVKTVVFNGVARGTINVGSGTYNVNTATCSVAGCHGDGRGGAPVTTPQWGDPTTGACGKCHYATPTIAATSAQTIGTNGHAAHLTLGYGPKAILGATVSACQSCHTYTTSTAITHVNGSVQVVSANCTTSCHKNGATWTSGRVTCESCHTGLLSVIGGKTAPAKTNFTASGHGQAGAGFDASRQCASCHDADSGHINGTSGDQKRIAVNDYTLCAGCHNDAIKVPTATRRNVTRHAVDLGNYTMECKTCHDVHGTGNRAMVRTTLVFGALTSTISYATTADLVQLQAPYRGVCQTCHTKTSHYRRGVNEGSGHPTTGCLNCHSHRNTFAFKPKACDECHGYPPTPKGFVASQANYSTARLENYSGGGGAHVKLGHLMSNLRPSQGFTPCLTCHYDGAAAHVGDESVWAGGSTQQKKSAVNVKIDPTYKFNADKGQWYSKQSPDATGSCWNVSCHFQPTPRWSDDK